MTEDYTTSYDDIPYTSLPFPQTHPDRLATIGALLGLAPPPIGQCRVLELGCAGGGNLIPMALQLPGSSFTGIDLSRRQIESGQALIQELGLENISLRQASITEIGPEFGQFDYVIAHGVYTWVPPAVQEALLRICRENLVPGGIAYVSYNVFPGWHMRGMIRDMMRYHTQRYHDPKVKVAQARALLNFLAQSIPSQNSPYSMLLNNEAKTLSKSPDYYLLHEHLEDINEPLYFHQFIERVKKHRLQYLSEASFASMADSILPPDVVKTLSNVAFDVVSYEQYLDFVRNRTFRQTLLVHEETVINRKVDWRHVLRYGIAGAGGMKPVSQAVDLNSAKIEQFRGSSSATIAAAIPLVKAALSILSSLEPLPVPFGELTKRAASRVGMRAEPGESEVQQLALSLLQAYSIGLCEFTQIPAGFALESTRLRPMALQLARVQAKTARQVTNALHKSVPLTEEQQSLLSLLDGNHDRKALIEAMRTRQHSNSGDTSGAEKIGAKSLDKNAAAALVDSSLAFFGRQGLLAPV